MIPRKEILELSNVQSSFCISIFIPTHRAGEETLKGQDALNLKNQLKEVRQKLRTRGFGVNEIKIIVTPVIELIDDSEFWRHQSDGLAIFISEDVFRKYTVPVYFEEYNYISREFYLKPLMPLFNGDGLFYLLTLKTDEVKLYEGTRHSIAEIVIDDLIPERLEEHVGYDYEQKGLQFRTQQGSKGKALYHGHGDSNTEKKNELFRYFRAIDRGLISLFQDDQKAPLILCCLDYHFPIYREANNYQNLFPRYIAGNPSDKDVFLLHEEAWELLRHYFSTNRREKLDQYIMASGTGKASSNIREILPAALLGKIDTLFLENRADIFGIYSPSTGEVILQETHKSPNVSLMNLAAVKVFEQGGTVYLLDKDEMPDRSSEINALFRYL